MGTLRLQGSPNSEGLLVSLVVIESLLSKYVLHSLQNAVAKLRKGIGINEENEKNVRGDGFSFYV